MKSVFYLLSSHLHQVSLTAYFQKCFYTLNRKKPPQKFVLAHYWASNCSLHILFCTQMEKREDYCQRICRYNKEQDFQKCIRHFGTFNKIKSLSSHFKTEFQYCGKEYLLKRNQYLIKGLC